MTSDTITEIELWVALPTPFTPTGQIDEHGLRLNVTKCIEAGLDGVYCNGLMGEAWALSLHERRRVLEIIVDESAGRIRVSPVTTAGSLMESIDLTAHALHAGADYSVLAAPSASSDREALDYLDEIMSAVDMPYVVFNAGRDGSRESLLSPAAVADLCRDPRVRILKTTAALGQNVELRRAAKGSHLLVSDPLEEHFFENMTRFGQRILYCDPEGYLYQSAAHRPIRDYVDLFLAGRIPEARRVFDSLAALRSVYREWIIGPLERGDMPNAALKRWCEIIGMAGGSVRAPLEELAPERAGALERDLAEAMTTVEAERSRLVGGGVYAS